MCPRAVRRITRERIRRAFQATFRRTNRNLLAAYLLPKLMTFTLTEVPGSDELGRRIGINARDRAAVQTGASAAPVRQWKDAMAISPMVRIRMSEEAIKAAKEKAAEHGLTLSLWIRRWIEEQTGVNADLPQGVAALPPKERKLRVAKIHKALADKRKAKKAK